MVATGTTLIMLFNCSEKQEQIINNSEVPSKQELPDLSEAIQKRVEKKPKEAIVILRKFNEDFPNTPKILIQLSRALVDNGQFSLAAFRLEQAMSAGAPDLLLKECAEIYILANDFNSAEKYLGKYLEINPEDKKSWISLAKIYNQNGKEREALNAFEKAREEMSDEDSLLAGNLYLKKGIFVQAENWFKQSAQKEEFPTERPLIGLLRVKIANSDMDSAESLLFAIEKKYPNTLSKLPENSDLFNFIIRRRMNDLNERKIITQNLNISQLIRVLLEEKKESDEPVVAIGPKLNPQPQANDTFSSPPPVETQLSKPTPEEESTSLADVFSNSPTDKIRPSAIETGWSAYLSRNYDDALLYAREAINQDGGNSEAWRLSSQAHFQLGEIREAEMTILEAIRHNPDDLQTRMDYLNIARETLSSDRYLIELENTHELFPQSGEILWQLARRYHLVERMPVTAGILYQKLLRIVPENSNLYYQAEMELIKIRNP